MYTIDITTKNHSKRIVIPQKARAKHNPIFNSIQVMDYTGKWHTICRVKAKKEKLDTAVLDIQTAIKRKNSNVTINI